MVRTRAPRSGATVVREYRYLRDASVARGYGVRGSSGYGDGGIEADGRFTAKRAKFALLLRTQIDSW